MAVSTAGSVAKAISELVGLIRDWLKDTDARANRRFKKAAWKYIEVNENKKYKKSTKAKYLAKWKKVMREN